MLWGCPGEPWTCYQLYSGRFFYCKIKRQERHYDRSHERSRPLQNLAQVKLLAFNTNLDVLAISETHLSPALKDHEIAIQGYQILRRDRLGRTGGGVVIYYKDSLDCISIEKYDNPDIEATWLEVKIRSQRLLVGCIYRPPDFGGFYDIFRPILFL